MDQITLRKNRGVRRFDEIDWTITSWRDRKARNYSTMHADDGNCLDVSENNTIIGVIHVGALVIFMLAYLT